MIRCGIVTESIISNGPSTSIDRTRVVRGLPAVAVATGRGVMTRAVAGAVAVAVTMPVGAVTVMGQQQREPLQVQNSLLNEHTGQYKIKH